MIGKISNSKLPSEGNSYPSLSSESFDLVFIYLLKSAEL